MKAPFAAFMSGLLVMSVEMTASRILAPYVGGSIEVWTAIIVCIIASVGLGNLIGGRVADSRDPQSAMSSFFLAAAGCALATVVLHVIMLRAVVSTISDPRISALILAFLLFGPAAACLGAVTPLALKCSTRQLTNLGVRGGSIIALSSLGSILGTVLTGFVLVPFISYPQILMFIVALAAATAFTVRSRASFLRAFLCIAFCVLLSGDSEGWKQAGAARVLNIDTKYSRYQIIDSEAPGSGRQLRQLRNGPCGVQSVIFRDGADFLKRNDPFARLEHRLAAGTDIFAHDAHGMFQLWEHFVATGGSIRALMLGGGAFVYPQAFLSKYERATIDVVEVDPVLPGVAQKYFSLSPDQRLTVIISDARVFLNRNTSVYDILLVDLFNSACEVPFHVITRQAVSLMARALSDDGALVLNMISALEGRDSGFYRAVTSTLRAQFPSVHAYAVGNINSPGEVQNIALVAQKRKVEIRNAGGNPAIERYLQFYYESVDDFDPELVLRDEYAPVERMMARR